MDYFILFDFCINIYVITAPTKVRAPRLNYSMASVIDFGASQCVAFYFIAHSPEHICAIIPLINIIFGPERCQLRSQKLYGKLFPIRSFIWNRNISIARIHFVTSFRSPPPPHDPSSLLHIYAIQFAFVSVSFLFFFYCRSVHIHMNEYRSSINLSMFASIFLLFFLSRYQSLHAFVQFQWKTFFIVSTRWPTKTHTNDLQSYRVVMFDCTSVCARCTVCAAI